MIEHIHTIIQEYHCRIGLLQHRLLSENILYAYMLYVKNQRSNTKMKNQILPMVISDKGYKFINGKQNNILCLYVSVSFLYKDIVLNEVTINITHNNIFIQNKNTLTERSNIFIPQVQGLSQTICM